MKKEHKFHKYENDDECEDYAYNQAYQKNFSRERKVEKKREARERRKNTLIPEWGL